MVLFIVGPAASGKGTQADLLAKHYNIPHISMGQLLRDEIASGSDLGKEIEGIVDSGLLVPTEITYKLLVGAVEKAVNEHGGVIIDGYPREYAQILEINRWLDTHPTFIRCIHFTLSFEEILKRQKNRSETAGQARDDDNVLETRYKEQYLDTIGPIVAYYKEKGEYIEIDASPSIDKVFTSTINILDKQIQDA